MLRSLLYGFIISLLSSLLAAQPLYYAQVGSGDLGRTVFRTVFQLSNEEHESIAASLELFSPDGSLIDASFRIEWTGEEGTTETEPNGVQVTIPSQSSARVILFPTERAIIGWARLTSGGPLTAQSFFQFGEGKFDPEKRTSFEDLVVREVEVQPVTEIKSAVFPLYYLKGRQQLNTAFAIVNLSATPSSVTLTRRGAETRTIQLEGGASFAAYSDHFFELPPLEISPYIVDELVEISATVPIGLTVFRTLSGFPLSGVRIAQPQSGPNTINAELGEEFVLALNDTGIIDGEGLRVTFWNVLEDSRCPNGVTCIWEGRARVAVRVSLENSDLGEFELIAHAGNPEVATVKLGDFTLQLTRVDPYPNEDDGRIEASRYRLGLIVERSP